MPKNELVLQPPEEWQVVDIKQIVDRRSTGTGTTNFSEMGCKKTTTGLWALKAHLDVSNNPKVLIITTKSGKGTFIDFAPLIFPEWTVLSLDAHAISVLKDGHLQKIPRLKQLPQKIGMPVIVLAHYHLFSRSNHGKFVYDEKTGEPIEEEDGSIRMMEPTVADDLVAREWDFVVLDEAHRIKDKDTRWTVVIKRIKTPVENRHVMTGTGFINRPHEIWSLLNFIDRKRFGSFWAFYDLFCDIQEDDSGYSRVVGVKPEMKDEFRRIVREYGPRRTLDEVMPHLKKPLYAPRFVELNPTQRKMYDQIKNELYALDQSGTPLYAANVLTLLQRLRAICVATPEVAEDYYDEKLDRRVQKIRLVEPSSKLDCVYEILEGLEWDEDKRSPCVIFSNFVGPLKLLQTRFEKSNEAAASMGLEPEFPYIWLKESDNDEQRHNKWANLFPSMEYRVFMATVQTGGESINLTPARHAIFLDRSWSPKDNKQGIGRIRRPGQEGQPIIIHINTKDTVDQYIERVNEVKEGWFDAIFGAEVEPEPYYLDESEEDV